MGPAASNVWDTGTMPCVDTSPTVGRMVYSAARPAGNISEPSVSVPMENGAYPAETATAEPEEEPDGFSNSQRPLP